VFRGDNQWQVIQILDLLVDALSRHSHAVAGKDADLFLQVYHMTNISHITHLLNNFFTQLKVSAIKLFESSSQSIEPTAVSALSEALRAFTESISDNLELFDPDTPLVIFRNELRDLLIQVKILALLLQHK